jgi:hypothetical protein
MKNVFSKGMMGSLLAVSMLASGSAFAAKGGNGGTDLPAIDAYLTTTFDKSVINGTLAHDCGDGTASPTCTGDLVYDKAGNARFQYTGKIYAVETDDTSGELTKMSDDPIGEITGEAAFPPDFVWLSAAANEMMTGNWTDPAPKFPPIVPWTCNHCVMTVAGTKYISIVDALDPTLPDGVTPNPYYNINGIADSFDANVGGGAAASLATMRMDGRAFTGLGPVTFDPTTQTMGIRMAGCSALVAISGPEAGKAGTLCMNATAVFNVSGAHGTFTDDNGPTDEDGNPVGHHMNGYKQDSVISAEGSSNCVTVMQQMPQQ